MPLVALPTAERPEGRVHAAKVPELDVVVVGAGSDPPTGGINREGGNGLSLDRVSSCAGRGMRMWTRTFVWSFMTISWLTGRSAPSRRSTHGASSPSSSLSSSSETGARRGFSSVVSLSTAPVDGPAAGVGWNEVWSWIASWAQGWFGSARASERAFASLPSSQFAWSSRSSTCPTWTWPPCQTRAGVQYQGPFWGGNASGTSRLGSCWAKGIARSAQAGSTSGGLQYNHARASSFSFFPNQFQVLQVLVPVVVDGHPHPHHVLEPAQVSPPSLLSPRSLPALRRALRLSVANMIALSSSSHNSTPGSFYPSCMTVY